MKPIRIVSISILLLAFTASLAAAEPSAPAAKGENTVQELALEPLLQEALQKNPTVLEARDDVTIWQHRLGHTGTMPNPQFKATFWLVPIETRVGPQWVSLALSQRFPFFGKLTAKKNQVAAMLDAVGALSASKIRNVLLEIKDVYFELHYLTRALEVVELKEKLASEMTQAALRESSDDGTSHFDLQRVRVEESRLEYDRQLLEDKRAANWERLQALLGREGESEIPRVPALPLLVMPLELDELMTLAKAHQQELAAARLSIDVADRAVEGAQKDFWPDFTLGVNWMINEASGPAPDAGKDAFGITIGVDIPIWRSSLKAAKDEALARKRQARHKVAARLSDTRKGLADAFYRLKTQEKQLQVLVTVLLPQARASMEEAQQERPAGGIAVVLERRLCGFACCLHSIERKRIT